MADPLREAATRLEMAVDRLAVVAAQRRAALRDDEVADLGRRLDAALGRLRALLAADDGGPETDEEGADPSRPEQES